MGSERKPGRHSRSGLPWAVLVASLALTALVAYLAGAAAEARDQVRFRNAALGAQARVLGRMEVYVALLRGTAGLFATDPNVRLPEFQDYAARLQLRVNYPGTQGLGFSRRLRPDQVDSVEAAMHAQGVPDFRVHPAGGPGDRHAIVYLEPLDERNRGALGFDMSSEPVRAAAMARARDSGLPAMTGRVRLIREPTGPAPPGFLIYMPAYLPGPIPATVAERRARLVGFVYSPFRAGDLFRGVFGDAGQQDVAFRVYDGDGTDPARLLFASHGGRRGAYARTATVDFAGQRWTLEFASTATFESGLRRRLGWALGAMGAAASLVLWWLTRAQARARDEAEQLALELQEKAAALQHEVAQSLALNRELEGSNRDLERARGDALDAARRAERLQGVAEALAEAATPDQVAEVVIRVGMRTSGVNAVAVYHQLEEELVVVRSAVASGRAEDRWRAVPLAADAPLAEAARRAQPLWLESPESLRSRYPALREALEEAGDHALAALPLLVDGQAHGVLGVVYPAAHDFPPAERTYWRTLARITAQAMERARLFAAEQAARAEAEEANRAKSEFLSAMSHELRTPLNAIGGYAELLEMGIRGAVSEEQQADLQRIRRAQRHLLGLINDMLNFTRLEAGRVELRPVELPIPTVLSDLRAMTEPQVRAQGLRAEYDPGEGLLVRADPERLQQILLNLVGNAIKFTASGGLIRVNARAVGDRLEIRVEDTGRGIPADRLDSIFDPFVQVDRRETAASQQGIGLGLAISRDLAVAMGGDITVESREGVGSAFTLSLPQAGHPPHDGVNT